MSSSSVSTASKRKFYYVEGNSCPRCDGKLIVKSRSDNRDIKFLACSNFLSRRCRFTWSLNKEIKGGTVFYGQDGFAYEKIVTGDPKSGICFCHVLLMVFSFLFHD